MLTEKGLQQLSLDDVAQNCDAFTDNSNVTNCICQDREFTLNALVYDALPANAVYIATSDGFTDSCKPFEQELMATMQLATLNGDFNDTDKLTETFNKFLTDRRCSQSDDCSMAVAITGFKDKTDFANAISSRFNIVRDNFYNEYNKSLKESTDAAQEYEKKKRDTARLYAIAAENIRKFLSQSAATYLIGDGNAEHAELRNWLLSKPYISSTLNELERKENAKKEQANKICSDTEKKLRKAYLDLYRNMCCYAAVFKKDYPELPIPYDIKSAIYSASETNEKLEQIEREYLEAKRALDELLDITAGSAFNRTASDNQYQLVITKRGDYISMYETQSADRNLVSDFFSIDTEYIKELFKKDYVNAFERQNVWMSYCDRSKFTVLFDIVKNLPNPFERRYSSIPKTSDMRDMRTEIIESKKRFEKALHNHDNACGEFKKATISDEEKRSCLTHAIETNINSLTEEMRKYPDFVRKYANADMSLISSQEEIKQAENRARELINKKNVLWAEYKPGYELFRTVNSIINARAGIE